MTQRLFDFAGGESGTWRVVATHTLTGAPLPAVANIEVSDGTAPQPRSQQAVWVLRGITSNERYVTRDEKAQLLAKQQGLGRTEATCAAMIPLRKNAAWWALTQEERREIFEAQSAHIQIGLKYLPAVARRLHHCRDLAPDAPFDFITWFEFAPTHTAAFDAMLAELRASPEWRYIEREIDFRMVREAP